MIGQPVHNEFTSGIYPNHRRYRSIRIYLNTNIRDRKYNAFGVLKIPVDAYANLIHHSPTLSLCFTLYAGHAHLANYSLIYRKINIAYASFR